MALPSRPNARLGLPASPSPRSRSLTARIPRQDLPPRPSSSASNDRPRAQTPLPPLPSKLRAQHSLNDLRAPTPSAPRRNPRPPPPPLPALNHLNDLPDRGVVLESRRSESEESISSLSSESSSSSSLLSTPALSDSGSSASSYGDDDEEKEDGNGRSPPTEGLGLLLWNRVAAAAGNLTVSVSKAIETNIISYSGEATPAGQETRLTRAMKEYYINKARDPADLPEWLFEQRDRGALGRLRIANATPEDDDGDLRKPVSVTPAPTQPIPIPRQPPPPAPVESSPASIMISRGKDGSFVRTREPVISRKQSRVRFAEQVHPKELRGRDSDDGVSKKPSVTDPLAMVRTTAVPPVPRRHPRLPDVNVHGRRPSAQGLPSGVRPQRPRVTAQ
ncbi:hypothetical protein BXZ70DRAFT_226639 [Cristinia sonorae]|uniref:Uncharacterized protein n=1 Tax=Cristinia sonorae TaxID=1940300 RepID=A0A8K0ULC3_9AGAR|nr:hypothetical protein BXZ70DRAFT_226639 [Cristinia sonorae]